MIIYFLDKKNDLLTVLLQVTRKKFLQVICLHVISCYKKHSYRFFLYEILFVLARF